MVLKGNKKAVFNLKHINGTADMGGPSVQLGAEEKYYPCCFICYSKQLTKAGYSFSDSVNSHAYFVDLLHESDNVK